jgi:hypothetical protein
MKAVSSVIGSIYFVLIVISTFAIMVFNLNNMNSIENDNGIILSKINGAINEDLNASIYNGFIQLRSNVGVNILYILYVYPNNSLSVKEVNLLIGKVPVNLGISNFNNLKVFLLSNNGRIYYLNDLIYNQLQSSLDPLGIYSYDINDPNAVTYTQYTSCEGVLPPCVVTNWYFNTSLIIRDLGTSAITIKSIYLDLKAYSPSLKTAQGFDYNGQLNGSFNPSLPVTLQPSSSITFRINSYLGSTSYSSSAPVYSSGSAYYVATIFIVYQNQDLTQEYQSFTIFYGMAP